MNEIQVNNEQNLLAASVVGSFDSIGDVSDSVGGVAVSCSERSRLDRSQF